MIFTSVSNNTFHFTTPLSKSIINEINSGCLCSNSFEKEELAFDLDDEIDSSLVHHLLMIIISKMLYPILLVF